MLSDFRMNDTVPRAEYDRIVTQRNHVQSENDAMRLDVAQLRSQFAPQVQCSHVAQIVVLPQSARCYSRSSGSAHERTATVRPAKRLCVYEHSVSSLSSRTSSPSSSASFPSACAVRAIYLIL